MTKAEQEAFEKWLKSMGEIRLDYTPFMRTFYANAFKAGYRAGFEAQHYDIDDVSKEKVENGRENKG